MTLLVGEQDVSCNLELWYLIQCNPRKEQYAASVLKEQLGLTTLLPPYTTHSRGQVKQLPLFPGYIFAQANLQKAPLSRINTCPGVMRLVDFESDPPPYVPDNVIGEISRRMSTMSTLPTSRFRPGETVHLKGNSALQDMEMIFVGPVRADHRVRVLLHLLGQFRETYVDIERLERRHMDLKRNV